MSVKIAAWNVARGLSDEHRQGQIAEALRTIDADIVILTESHNKDGAWADEELAAKLGYTAVTREYHDRIPHPSEKQYITVLGRMAVEPSQIRIGNRDGLEVTVKDPENGKSVRVIGSHFDDRSERKRRIMGRSLTYRLNPDEATVVAGDLNNTHKKDRRSRFLSSWPVQVVSRLMPIARLRSLGTRLSDMAKGEALEMLEERGLVDADPTHSRTFAPKFFRRRGLAQLDHIMYTPETVRTSDFTVHKTPGSDHWAVSAVVEHL